MKLIRKKIVTDESHRPVAVQIDYADWLEIERMLADVVTTERRGDIRPFIGKLKNWTEDPVEYQRRVRDEWD